jgi:uncharacterized protein YcfJ
MDKRRTNEVFIAGRYPELTYNPRGSREQEKELKRYLADSGKALTISGPSKSGKTVLLQHNLPETDAIWINGSDLTSASVLYGKIVDWLGIFDMLEVQQQSGTATGGKIGAALKLRAAVGSRPSSTGKIQTPRRRLTAARSQSQTLPCKA